MRALVEKYGSFSATDVDSAVYENGVASGKEVVSLRAMTFSPHEIRLTMSC